MLEVRLACSLVYTHILTQVLIVCTLLYHSWGKTFCVDTLVGAFYRLACVNRILKDSHTFASFSLGFIVLSKFTRKATQIKIIICAAYLL